MQLEDYGLWIRVGRLNTTIEWEIWISENDISSLNLENIRRQQPNLARRNILMAKMLNTRSGLSPREELKKHSEYLGTTPF